MALVSTNPTTGKVIARYAAHSKREVEARLASAHAAAALWRGLSGASRARHLRALAAGLHREREALAALICAEMGKPLAEGLAEVAKCVDCCRHYAKYGAALLKSEVPPHAPPGVVVVPEALGVILAIMPWNYPLWQVIRALVPAVVAGNVVLLKHASNVCGSALALCDVARRVGWPVGVLECVFAASADIAPLIADERIRGVTLTGSTAAGRAVAALAGAALKPFVGELGGSDPYLIFPDADLDAAATIGAAARLVNNGQSCIAAKRFIVHARVAEEFTGRLASAMAAFTVGDPTRAAVQLGPMASCAQRDELHAQVARVVRRGAQVVIGGSVPSGPGAFYPPTVLAGIHAGIAGADEEFFGPAAMVETAPDEEAMLAVANRSTYGLGGALFTRDVARARSEWVPRLQAGMVFVNHAVRSHVAVPFGGSKRSGLGRELGPAGVRAFTNPKTVWMA